MTCTLTRKVFLDTCVVNRLSDFGEYVFDNCLCGEAQSEYLRRPIEDQEDIEALRDIVQVFRRVCMPLYITPTTIEEIGRANRHFLENYTLEIFHHWWDWGDPQNRNILSSENFQARVTAVASTLTCFPDEPDRKLIAEAVVVECDIFLTVDRRSIWRHRDKVKIEALQILRPSELWSELGPWAALVN